MNGRRLDVNFSTFGDRSTASSRLRAWMLADELRRRGHHVTVNAARLADVEVFQKVRNWSRLDAALERGSRIVLDFDDNYLLDDLGTRDEMIAAMNTAALVTVGSRALAESASRFHERVELFENPLDVEPGAPPRDGRGWTGRIGWFGNRGGLSALAAVDLGDHGRAVTVTRGGDVEWELKTIDAVLRGFDVVVLPADESEWGTGKNANRLLKCVALAVPAVASRTPEHERVARRLRLPESVLVERGASWSDALARVRDEYDAVQRAFAAARDRAWAHYGIGAAAARWEELVASLERPAAPAPPRAAAAPGRLAVVVVADDDAADLAATLRSLRTDSAGYASVGVVDAGEHDDFFAVYPALARAVAAASAPHVLVLRAGVELRPAFFALAGEVLRPGAVTHLVPQVVPAAAGRARSPRSVEELLAWPHVPWAVVLPTREVARAGGLDGRHLAYALWELLVRLARDAVPASVVETPVAAVPAALLERHAIHAYSAHAIRRDPRLADELPGLDAEWERLRFTLHSQVVDQHRELFARHVPAILPMLAAAPRAGARPPRASPVPPPPAGWARAVWRLAERRGVPPALRRAVRAGWRTLRPLVPDEARVRAYRRHRALYELFFPDRRPPRR
ncbi:MAG TPA: hypothetical protein VHF89_20735 [Solirubrobacteraceae bacterium]|nr:hypothetical protein [Solirubrobacteraceae bacterium]